MLKIFSLFLLFFCVNQHPGLAQKNSSSVAANGKKLFETNCLSCHGISNGNFGPKLGGVQQVRSTPELISFIKNSDKFIKDGDKRTIALLQKYKNPMPAFTHLADNDIGQIIDYITTESEKSGEKPLDVSGFTSNTLRRFAPPVQPSNLYVEVTDFLTFPKQPNTPGDKGIATLRTTPVHPKAFFIGDQMGIIYRVEDSISIPFFDIRKYRNDFVSSPGIGTGLGSFDFHPDYKTNGLFYTTHAELYAGKPAINQGAWVDSIGVGLQWVITEWKNEQPTAESFAGKSREILRFNTPTTAHGGQDVCFSPITDKSNADYGLLYLGIGDGGSNNIKLPELGHSNRSLLGTIIRIDPLGKNGRTSEYGIPANNPFAGKTDQRIHQEIYAFGFRNPHRFAWKGDTLVVADIGEANIEELNVLVKGKDYGWPNQEGGYGVDTKTDKTVLFEISNTERKKFTAPLALYDHADGKAISGGFFYDGPIESLRNKYIFGDIVTGKLYYINSQTLDSPQEIFEINLVYNNEVITLKELASLKRAHLRIGYDSVQKQLYIMTKNDQSLRKITNAYVK